MNGHCHLQDFGCAAPDDYCACQCLGCDAAKSDEAIEAKQLSKEIDEDERARARA